MWYEVLPAAIIMTVLLSLPNNFLHYSQIYFLGTCRKRSLLNPSEFYLYHRDEALTGNAYKTIGLEGIPDADTK